MFLELVDVLEGVRGADQGEVDIQKRLVVPNLCVEERRGERRGAKGSEKSEIARSLAQFELVSANAHLLRDDHCGE